jgi:DNA polymerase III subunit epsilon
MLRDALSRWRRRRALRQDDLPEALRACLSAPWPEARQPWRAARYLALDFETTGLDPQRDAIVQIGCVAVEQGRVRLDSAWSALARPPAALAARADAIRIHGLLPERLAAAPALAELLPALLERLAGHVLLLHVAAVDLPFLERALRTSYGHGLALPWLDTAALATAIVHQQRLIAPQQHAREPLRLADLARAYGIPVAREHDALADALTTAQLFLAQAQALEAFGITTLGGLRRAGG